MFGSLPQKVIIITPIEIEQLAMSLIRHLVFYLDGYMKRLIFGSCRLPNLAMRYYLLDVEYDEPIYIDACQRSNHLVTIKYHLYKIMIFEYACELMICLFDFVLVRDPVR
jgi:hypothetical protein